MISVEKIDEQTFNVRVDGASTTEHKVTVEPAYYQELTGGQVPVEDLVQRSFEFLLQRESNTSILRSFDLPVINRYFPDYENAMKRQFGT